MITEAELKTKFAEKNFLLFETVDSMTEIIDKVFKFEGTADDLLNFMSVENIRTGFYGYGNYFPGYFDITEEDVIEKCDVQDAWSLIKQEASKHNDKVSSLDYSEPFGLIVFCMYNGSKVGIVEINMWGSEYETETVINDMLENRQKELADKKAEEWQKILNQRETMRQKILADDSFYRCTNLSLRRSYAKSFFEKSSNSHFRDAFYSKEHGVYDILINDFIEDIWREIKQTKR